MVGIGRLCRGLALVAGTMLMVLLGIGSAAAHVEVSVEPAQAGARDAVVTFSAAAESDTAGISSVRVQLPDGIAPADVTLASGPPGWALTATPDGYTVSGPPLPVGDKLSYAIKVTRLPDAPSVAFKTVQSYTDGTADRWIGLPAPGGTEPENPAPMATLAPAAAADPAPAAPEPVRAQPANPTVLAADDGGVPVLVWIGIAVLAIAAVTVGMLVLRRRASGGSGG